MGPRSGLDGCGKSRPTGIRSPYRPSRSESIYRLSYPGPHTFQSTTIYDVHAFQWSDQFVRHSLNSTVPITAQLTVIPYSPLFQLFIKTIASLMFINIPTDAQVSGVKLTF